MPAANPLPRQAIAAAVWQSGPPLAATGQLELREHATCGDVRVGEDIAGGVHRPDRDAPCEFTHHLGLRAFCRPRGDGLYHDVPVLQPHDVLEGPRIVDQVDAADEPAEHRPVIRGWRGDRDRAVGCLEDVKRAECGVACALRLQLTAGKRILVHEVLAQREHAIVHRHVDELSLARDLRAMHC